MMCETGKGNRIIGLIHKMLGYAPVRRLVKGVRFGCSAANGRDDLQNIAIRTAHCNVSVNEFEMRRGVLCEMSG